EIDRGDAEIAESADVGDEVGVTAGKQAAVAVGGDSRHGVPVALDAVGQRNRVRVAPGCGGQLTQPSDAGLIARQRVEEVRVVAADRIPRVSEARRAPQGGAARSEERRVGKEGGAGWAAGQAG